MRRTLALPAVCALALLLGGCGESGVSNGATVSVYVGASICPAAKQELARHGGDAGDLEVRAVCLPASERDGRLDLATTGANARAATEDSSSIAYLEAPGPANRFTSPILDEAGIAFLTADSGKVGITRVLDAIEAADPASLRDSVRNALDKT